MGYQSAWAGIMLAVYVAATCVIIIGPPPKKGDCIMCTGAEAPAAASAKSAADVAAASGAAGGVAGGTGLTIGTAGATGLTAGTAAGLTAMGGGTGLLASEAALAGFGTGAAAAGAGLSTLLTAKNVTAGASAINAGTGLLAAMRGAKVPAAPALTKPLVMPAPDDEATQRARRAMLTTLSQRRGRSSTILSNDTLGN